MSQKKKEKRVSASHVYNVTWISSIIIRTNLFTHTALIQLTDTIKPLLESVANKNVFTLLRRIARWKCWF
jgi:hypothetical protein